MTRARKPGTLSWYLDQYLDTVQRLGYPICVSWSKIVAPVARARGVKLTPKEQRNMMDKLERNGHRPVSKTPPYRVVFAFTKPGGLVDADFWHAIGGSPTKRERGNYVILPQSDESKVFWWRSKRKRAGSADVWHINPEVAALIRVDERGARYVTSDASVARFGFCDSNGVNARQKGAVPIKADPNYIAKGEDHVWFDIRTLPPDERYMLAVDAANRGRNQIQKEFDRVKRAGHPELQAGATRDIVEEFDDATLYQTLDAIIELSIRRKAGEARREAKQSSRVRVFKDKIDDSYMGSSRRRKRVLPKVQPRTDA